MIDADSTRTVSPTPRALAISCGFAPGSCTLAEVSKERSRSHHGTVGIG
jgi:hypothetical protein